MNPYIPFEIALVLLAIAYLNPMLLLIVASNVGLVVIEAV